MKTFDLHAHPSLKPFGNIENKEESYNLWTKRKNKFKGREVIKEIDKDGFYWSTSGNFAIQMIDNTIEDMVAMYSQSNFDDAVNGNVKCIVHSFYPIEQEFFKRGKASDDHFFDHLLSMISGQSVEKINDIQKGKNAYFEEYQSDRKLLSEQQRISQDHSNWKYKIVNNYSEYKETTENPNEIAIILSIEGVQSLANKIGAYNDYKKLKEEADLNSPSFEKWKWGLLSNLRSVKLSKTSEGKKNEPILFLTIAHHFFNYVCGHCKSLNLPKYFLDQEDFYHENQEGKHENIHYFDLGITKTFGYDVIEELLKRDPNKGIRRIIPDIKHLSPQARLDFYNLLDSPQYQNEKIPIICSHTAVNGIKKIRRTNSEDESEYFSALDINTFDDDIIEIYKRDGLMGIMLDDGRSCSKKYLKIVRKLDNKIERKKNQSIKIEKKYKGTKSKRARRKLKRVKLWNSQIVALKKELGNEYCDIFFRQIFHIINVLNMDENAGEQAWKIITLGTDFDGVINPYDYYGSYSRINNLGGDLIERWYEHIKLAEESHLSNDFTKNLFGQSPEYWINKVFWQNSDDFLKKYFHDDYLIHGNVD